MTPPRGAPSNPARDMADIQPPACTAIIAMIAMAEAVGWPGAGATVV